ncbi:MAG: hypothetical protein SGPRY_001567 [Prymnesium sp.]
MRALKHLSLAMLYAGKAADGPLLLGAAQRFWRHCKPFDLASPRLPLLREPVALASQQLEELAPSLQPKVLSLRVRLYELLLSALAKANAWGEGLRLVGRAFSTLPASEHQPLWEQKVRFMCKGGKRGLAGEMHRLKDFEPEMQARVWGVVGACAEGKGDQMHALMRAVDVTSSLPLQKVEHLITLAEWLFCNGFSLKEAEDQLMAGELTPRAHPNPNLSSLFFTGLSASLSLSPHHLRLVNFHSLVLSSFLHHHSPIPPHFLCRSPLPPLPPYTSDIPPSPHLLTPPSTLVVFSPLPRPAPHVLPLASPLLLYSSFRLKTYSSFPSLYSFPPLLPPFPPSPSLQRWTS